MNDLKTRADWDSLSASLDSTESGSLPFATGNELERTSRDFFSSSGDSNDGGSSPSLVASLKGLTHDHNVSSAIAKSDNL